MYVIVLTPLFLYYRGAVFIQAAPTSIQAAQDQLDARGWGKVGELAHAVFIGTPSPRLTPWPLVGKHNLGSYRIDEVTNDHVADAAQRVKALEMYYGDARTAVRNTRFKMFSRSSWKDVLETGADRSRARRELKKAQ